VLKFFAKSLRRKMLLAFVVASFVPAITGLLMATYATETVLERGFGQFWDSAADSVARRIDERLFEITTAVSLPATWEGFASAAAREGGLGGSIPLVPPRVDSALGRLATLLVVDHNGTEIAVSRYLPEDERLLLRRAVSARLAQSLASGRPPDRALRLPPDLSGRRRIAILFPMSLWESGDVHSNGIADYYGAMTIAAEYLERELRDSRLENTELLRVPAEDVPEQETPNRQQIIGAELTRHLERRGSSQFVGHFAASRMIEGKPRAIVYRQIRGLSSIEGSGADDLGWYVTAAVDLGDISAAREMAMWRTLTALSAMFLGVIGLAVWMSRRITRPLRLLRNELSHLASGRLDIEVEVTTHDEIAELGRDVNTMARRLADTYRNLEASIEQAEQRAGQLQIINEITTAMTSAMTIDQTFGRFGSMLRRLGRFDHCGLTLVSPKDGSSLTHHVSQHSLHKANPFHDKDIREAIRLERPSVLSCAMMALKTDGELCSATIFPLNTRTDVIGTLNLASSRAGTFNADIIGSLTFIAEALAAAIQHNRLYEEVRDFAQSLEVKVRQRTRELEEAQQRLVQVEKFAATGKLAANLAHEINNPLGIIRNHLQLLKERCVPKVVIGADGTVSGNIEDPLFNVIQEEIGRIARLTRSLLNFYRAKPAEERMISLVREMEEILLLVRDTLERRHIRVRLQVAGHIPDSWLPSDQVRQVFMNLLRNAEDAMEDCARGELSMAMRVLQHEDEGEESRMIEVSISDSGKGMTQDTMMKIFDPFFTTKGEEKGTGLGLSVTLGIMNALGGSIDVASVPGEGTTFTLRFPVRSPQRETTSAKGDMDSVAALLETSRPASGRVAS
jgi:signal transduction histidine kinase